MLLCPSANVAYLHWNTWKCVHLSTVHEKSARCFDLCHFYSVYLLLSSFLKHSEERQLNGHNEVGLLLPVTQDYKFAKATENIDWEACQNNYRKLDDVKEQYPADDTTYPYSKDELTTFNLITKQNWKLWSLRRDTTASWLKCIIVFKRLHIHSSTLQTSTF